MSSITVDGIELVALLDGAQDLAGPIDESFPSVPSAEWARIHSVHPELVSARGSWRLHDRCTLLRALGRTILVDTGVGHLVAPEWFGATSQLSDELAAVNVQPSDIDTVVITHVHDDHIGGTVTAAREPAFPNARHLVHGADLDWQRDWAVREEEDRVIYETLLLPLEHAGLLEAVKGDIEIAEGIRLRHAPGHTPGHQMVEVGGAGGRALISGDAFNHPVQISEPSWYGNSDDDPDMATSVRRALLDEIAGGDVLMAPSHFAEPFGRVEPGPDGRPHWVPA